MKIGHWNIDGKLILAPMAGITDLPFRNVCLKQGAAMAVSEMVTSDLSLVNSKKTRLRLIHQRGSTPVSIQIVGTNPQQMAEAAKYNADHGADIIDINMGCPAKKVCKKAAGSALLRDESLVQRILKEVVKAVDIPVTLKIRTGWSPEERNAPTIARIAEDSGIAALSVHGRTKACLFKGTAEFQTIRQVKKTVNIPVIANGDINTPAAARRVLQETQADALMIGRGAFGWPWIFSQINAALNDTEWLPPDHDSQKEVILGLLDDYYRFYGENSGLRIARKHLGWYLDKVPGGSNHKKNIYAANSADAQMTAMKQFFDPPMKDNTCKEGDHYVRSYG